MRGMLGIRGTAARSGIGRGLIGAIAVGALAVGTSGCGGGEEASSGAASPTPPVSASQKPMAAEQAPASEKPMAAKQAPASAQQISADAQSCLDLVKQKQYVSAIDPCARALEESANADVEKAYAEAKAAVAEEARGAAAKTASDSLVGKPADQAAKDAAQGALGNLAGSGDAD